MPTDLTAADLKSLKRLVHMAIPGNTPIDQKRDAVRALKELLLSDKLERLDSLIGLAQEGVWHREYIKMTEPKPCRSISHD